MRLTDKLPSKVALQQRYRHPSPTNRNANVFAQRAVDTLSTVMAEKSNNAVKIDGWPSYVHLYRFGSKVCTCKGDSGIADSVSISGPANSIISEDIAQKPAATFVLRGEFDERGLSTPHQSDLQSFTPDERASVVMDTDVDEYQPDDIDVNNVLNAYSTLDDKPCGICGASGFIDTYQWISGHKILLLPDDAAIVNCDVNDNTRPHSIDMYAGGSATWDAEIPAYFYEVEAWRVRDNTQTAHELKITVDLSGSGNGPWTPFSTGVFDGFKGVGGKVKIRVDPVRLGANEVAMFTHAEILLRTVELPSCQFPQLDRDISAKSIESIINTNFELEPRVGLISRRTLIEVPAMGRMWMVTGVSMKQTAKGFVFNISGQVLVVQPNMPVYALAISPRWQGQNLAGASGVISKSSGVQFPHANNPMLDIDGTAQSSRRK